MRTFLFLFFLSLIFTRCDLYRELSYSSDEDKKIVINGYISLLEGVNLQITHSLPVTDQTILLENIYLNDALVLLFEENILIDTLVNTDERGAFRLSKAFTPSVGYAYHVEVLHNDYPNVKTEKVIMPKKTDIINGVSDFGIIPDFGSEPFYSVHFSIYDDASEKNYYLLEALSNKDNIVFDHGISMQIAMSSEEQSCLVLPLSDFCFNGDSLHLSVLADNIGYEQSLLTEFSNESPDILSFYLHSVSESYYNNFIRNTSLDEEISPFLSSDISYSNVENGYGIFVAMNSDLFIINK